MQTQQAHLLVDRISTLTSELAAAKKELSKLLAMEAAAESAQPSSAGARTAATPTAGARNGRPSKPISERVFALLQKGPHSFEELWTKLGAENKAAIRSHVDKRRASGDYAHDGEQYSIAVKKAKPAKAKPAPAKKKPENKKAPTGSSGEGVVQAELPV